MRTRYRISVGGVQLDTLDDSIAILDIGYQQPNREVKKQSVANLDGYAIADTYTGQGTVTVTFEIRKYGIADRNAVCQKVNAWAANGGSLTVNDRASQYLQSVTCEQFADIASARNWTDSLTVVFATTVNPYWVSISTKTRTITGTSISGTLAVDGNTGSAPVSVTITASASISTIQITVGSTKLKLTGLNVTSGQQIVVDYVSSRFLRVRANGSSVMSKLDPASSDRLLAKCGASTSVGIVSNGKMSATFTGRGMWLW